MFWYSTLSIMKGIYEGHSIGGGGGLFCYSGNGVRAVPPISEAFPGTLWPEGYLNYGIA